MSCPPRARLRFSALLSPTLPYTHLRCLLSVLRERHPLYPLRTGPSTSCTLSPSQPAPTRPPPSPDFDSEYPIFSAALAPDSDSGSDASPPRKRPRREPQLPSARKERREPQPPSARKERRDRRVHLRTPRDPSHARGTAAQAGEAVNAEVDALLGHGVVTWAVLRESLLRRGVLWAKYCNFLDAVFQRWDVVAGRGGEGVAFSNAFWAAMWAELWEEGA